MMNKSLKSSMKEKWLRGSRYNSDFFVVFMAWVPMAKVNDSVDVFLIKATRKYFSMVLFITLDNVLTFHSLES